MRRKAGKITPEAFFLSAAFWLAPLWLIICLSTLSCRPRGSDAGLLPRPQPGYTAWLEKQSMSAQADKLIAQVSQTGRVWMFSGRGAPVDALLKAAPQWLELSSSQFFGQNFFTRLEADLPLFQRAGVRGLYLGPLGEDQSYWRGGEKSAGEPFGAPLPASLEMDPRLGDEKAFVRLAETAEKAGMELGADLVAGHTSMGPDFFLQARAARGHEGLYAMLELPHNLWDQAPPAPSEWEGRALSPDQIKSFSSQGVLPQSLDRDSRAWGPPSGWAVTGEVLGADGKLRRWLYRYEGDPGRPVFLWQDPAALARKIFSGAIIQHTGFWRIPLAGLRLSSLMGLEPGQTPGKDETQSLAPGLEALNILSGIIHRYGGWALQADPLPVDVVEKVLAGDCDFCREDQTENLLLEAAESGDPSRLAALYKGWLERDVDQRRLARGFNAWERLQVFNSSKSASAGVSSKTQTFNKNNKNFAETVSLSWRLGLPGLAFIAPEELGVSAAAGISPDQDERGELANLLAARAALSLAEGRLIKVVRSGSALALLSSLPQKGYWLVAANFSGAENKISAALPDKCVSAEEAAIRKDLGRFLDDGGRSFTISLDGYEARHVIFYVE